jgi:transcriptional repressor NrdR
MGFREGSSRAANPHLTATFWGITVQLCQDITAWGILADHIAVQHIAVWGNCEGHRQSAMRCPSCKELGKDKVIDSRLTESGAAVRRRRVCSSCGRRFTTKERAEEELRLTVVKKDRTRVPYRRDKIVAGVRQACYKLEVNENAIEALVDQVEGDLFRDYEREITSLEIGNYVARRLRDLNQVAYVRFMSVYREFHDVDEFVEEIRNVQEHAATATPNQQSLFGQ